MTLTPRRPVSESAGVDYVGGLAQAWASLEAVQRWFDDGPDSPRTLDEIVGDFLQSEDPYPSGTAVFAARWRPGRWGPGMIIARVAVDEWEVEYLDEDGPVFRDHTELCPALGPAM
jgi:hypothetical protein